LKLLLVIILKIPLEIVCRLPHSYPSSSPPQVIARSSKLTISRSFYENLSKQINLIHNTDCSISAIIDWITDNLILEANNLENHKTIVKPVKIGFSRVWLHFHHVYSTDKKQKLVSWATELGLSGFLMAGKPGMLCAEGEIFFMASKRAIFNHVSF
jgi:hypothetical protein